MGATDGVPRLRALAEVRELSTSLRLGFTPQEAVRWFSPAQLRGTAYKVAFSTSLAGFLDNRELQNSFGGDAVGLGLDAQVQEDLWFDFVADLGDGFDATYSVALLLAAEALAPEDSDRRTLPRGRFLVMGGDEVYPTPSADEYDNRTKGPYRTALPEDPEHPDGPVLLALPGNHDWYDGLTAFLRTFAQQRRIGAWRTRQTRSYWVARLGPGWWLAGLDTRFGGEIDGPQLDYFRRNLTAHLEPGHQVILCVASPAWVKAEEDPTAFDAMHYFERKFVRHRRVDEFGREERTGAVVRLWLTGDLHHWARYEEETPDDDAPRHLVTCGLGGAYLSGTHQLKDRIVLPPHDLPDRERDLGDPDDRGTGFTLRSASPPSTGDRRPWGLLWPVRTALPWRNRGFIPLMGGVQAVLFALAAVLLGAGVGSGPIRALEKASTADAGLLAALIAGAALAALLVRGVEVLRRRTREGEAPRAPRHARTFWPVVVASQVALAVLGVVGAVAVLDVIGWRGPVWPYAALCLLVAVPVLGFLAAWAFALALVFTRDPGARDWQDSAQGNEEHKGFVRLHLDAHGTLTLYPLIADRVVHRWREGADGRIEPSGGLPTVRLAEPPVVVLGPGRTVSG